MDNNDIKTSKSNVQYKKKNQKIIQNPKKEKEFKTEKKDIRNALWIIFLFIIMATVLVALPYISNYR